MDMEIEAKMPVNGLLESAGRRLMLLGRLIDEYGGTAQPSKAEDKPILEFTNAKHPVKAKRQTVIAAGEQNPSQWPLNLTV